MIDCNVDQLPFCCGVYEAGNFDSRNPYSSVYSVRASNETKLLENILDYCQGAPVIFNFVKKCNWEGSFNKEYDEQTLRTVVRNHPNVKHLHKGINPNSQNRVDTYMISGYTVIKKEEIEDEE